MKTTNYEISKQLAEAGFKAECAYLWFEKDQAIKIGDWIHPINKIEKINKEAISYLSENNKSYPAYDLETILEALPSRITNENFDKVPSWNLETILEALPSRITNENIFIQRIDYYLRLSKEEIWYENECNCDSDESCPVDQRFEVSRIKDESLADTAARLLLLLHEKNLIKF